MQRIPLLLSLLLASARLFAQAPLQFSFQAVVRDANDELLADTPVGLRISILQGTINGAAVYVETHSTSTNTNGLVSLQVGGGTVQSGSLATIDWGNGPYFIKSETDPNGGTNYTIAGTQQMMSVPYALFAANAGGGVFTSTAGVVHNTGTATEDFVFGSTRLNDLPGSDDNDRFFFDKDKGAFRAGRVSNTQWDNSELGYYSFAAGNNLRATGESSVALGEENLASGNSAIALGHENIAAGDNAVAGGYNCDALGENSIALGRLLTASGYASVALGELTNATGYAALSTGYYTRAGGNYSTAMGYFNTAPSFAETVLGRYNDTTGLAGDAYSWQAADRLFTIGNGTNDNARSNALVLLKNGNFGLGTNTPATRLHVENGSVLYSGTTGTTPASGAGTRLMWIPTKRAFRAGHVTGTQWDDGNVGQYSFAGGHNCTGSGNYAFAFGSNCMASGQNAIAMGQNGQATGLNAVALGATGLASGTCSVTLGLGGEATGHGSFTAGSGCISSGSAAAAIGEEVIARSWGEVVLGTYSADYTPASQTAWVATDRLLVIGNGEEPSERRNALVMLKNGNTGFGIDAPAAKIHVNDGGVRFTRSLTSTAWELNYDEAGNYFYLDQFGTARHLVVKAGGNTGLGTTDPKAKLHVSSGDVYIDNSTSGVIMKSPNGQCWRMTVSNAGAPVFSSITCP